MPKRKGDKPHQASCCTESEDPKRRKSKTGAANSIRAGDRTDKELPKWTPSMTGSKDTGPSLIKPSAEAELSMRQRLWRDEDKPSRKGSIVDTAGPDLAMLRNKGGGSKRRRSRTDEADPEQVVPETGGPEPVWDTLLTKGVRPECMRSRTKGESPARANDLNGKGGSIATPSRAEGEGPKQDMPRTNMAGSGWPKLRAKSGKPKRRRSKTGAAGPMRAHERADKDGPRHVASVTGRLKTEPTRPKPQTGTVGPRQLRDLNGTGGPRRKKSHAGGTGPKHPELLADGARPGCKGSDTDELGSSRTRPAAERDGPMILWLWIGMGSSVCRWSKADAGRPNQAKDLKDTDRPRCACAKTGEVKPKQVHEKTGMLEPSLAELRDSAGGSR